MHKDLTEYLGGKFPVLLEVDRTDPPTNPFQQFGIEIGSGWFRILYQMLVELEEIRLCGEHVYLRQVKEKFGGLRVYIDGPDKADDIVEKYSSMSYKICEICGEEGKLRSDGWYITLCDQHDEDRHSPYSEEIIKAMLKDATDGAI